MLMKQIGVLEHTLVGMEITCHYVFSPHGSWSASDEGQEGVCVLCVYVLRT